MQYLNVILSRYSKSIKMLAALLICTVVSHAQTTFTSGAISITDGSQASPYPSNIAVSALTGTVSNVVVKLNGVTTARPDDFDVLLVGPGGQTFVIMSDAGGVSTAVTNITLTLDDAAATGMPDGGPLTTATYKPTNFVTTDGYPSPAPAGPYNHAQPDGIATFASVFNGIIPNGTWSLYVIDDGLGGGNSSISSWSLIISTSSAALTSTTITSNNNPSFTTSPNNSVTFTATVSSSGNPVTTGTVTFKEGLTDLSAPTAVNASGQAAFTTTAFTEGNHTITAVYNGTSAFATSRNSLTQVVNNHTDINGNQFCNSNSAITIADNLNGALTSPYPSRIFVSGLAGTVSKVTVSINNFTAARPRDIDMLLVGPGGQKFVFMSDPGGATSAVSGINLTFDDAATSTLTETGTLTTGTFKPTNYGEPDVFITPAPAGPYNNAEPAGATTFAFVFNGISPNGTWSLYAVDDGGGGGASTIGSWCLNITPSVTAVATTTAITSNNNPSFTAAPNNSVTFTATVTSSSGAVNAGSVTFKEGATTLSGPTNVNASGQATFTTTSLSEGSHIITAIYDGTVNFSSSNNSLTQVVDNHTVVNGNQFCNSASGITIIDLATGISATPYPSHIFVSGIAGVIGKITVSINNFTAARPPDIDLLLVGPGGQKYVFMSDVGGVTSAVSNITLTFDDAAAATLPETGTLTTGTFKPTNAGTSEDPFLTPAPVGPYNNAAPFGTATFASVFNGANPNGTWSLYAEEDAGGGGNSTIGSWCITITPANAAPVVTASVGTTSFTEGNNVASTPVVIGGSITVTDDGTTLSSGTVSITGNFQSAQDVLAFTNIPATMGNIAGSYNASSGVLTLTSAGATAIVAQWQAALRSVTYTNSSNTPNTTSRTISFIVNDGLVNSNTATKTVSVTAVNDDPIITSNSGGNTAATSVSENTTAVTTVVATDADGTTPTYSLAGGADQFKFTINSTTGALAFITAPDFEVPADANTDNMYVVTVRATDGTANDDQTITVTVIDALETYYPRTASTDLSQTGNWTTDVNGGAGSVPPNFTSPNQVFNINRAATVLNSWTISGGSNLLLSTANGLAFAPSSRFTIGAASSADLVNNPVTFKSSVAGSASLGIVTGTLSNATNVTIERFIGIPSAKRAWRLLTSPLRGNTNNSVFNTWQMNGATTTGTGTLVTGPNYTGTGSDGLDANSGYSLKSFDGTNLVGVDNTKTRLLFTNSAGTTAGNNSYFIFIRGDRSSTSLTNVSQTTLRATGSLQTGDQAFATTVAANGFTLAGNPYTSPVDFDLFRQDNNVSNIKPNFYYWDPNLNAVGGYVTVSYDGSGSSYTITNGGTRYIQSGEAIFLQSKSPASGTASVIFKETQKTANVVNNAFRTGDQLEKLEVNLKLQNSDVSFTQADGIIAKFHNSYSVQIGNEDAQKLLNIDENLGFARYGQVYSIEGRPLADNDTLFLSTSNMKTDRSYKFEINAMGFNAPLVTAFLEDAFTGSSTALSLSSSSTISFQILSAAPASSSADRFRIVFKTSGALPVTYTNVKAYQYNTGVQVEWSIATENNIKNYEVERSGDGRNFVTGGTIPVRVSSNSNSSYTWYDAAPVNGANYYRIRAVENNGNAKYSQVVVVKMGGIKSDIVVYPNPATGNTINLQFINLPEGIYNVRLINQLGQVIVSKNISRTAGSSTETILLNKEILKGNYIVEVIQPDNSRHSIKIVY